MKWSGRPCAAVHPSASRSARAVGAPAGQEARFQRTAAGQRRQRARGMIILPSRQRRRRGRRAAVAAALPRSSKIQSRVLGHAISPCGRRRRPTSSSTPHCGRATRKRTATRAGHAAWRPLVAASSQPLLLRPPCHAQVRWGGRSSISSTILGHSSRRSSEGQWTDASSELGRASARSRCNADDCDHRATRRSSLRCGGGLRSDEPWDGPRAQLQMMVIDRAPRPPRAPPPPLPVARWSLGCSTLG